MLPGSTPAKLQVTALSCKQASRTGDFTSSSDGVALMTLPPAPTSTSSSILPATSSVSASARSKQRCTSAPWATSVDCRMSATRAASWS